MEFLRGTYLGSSAETVFILRFDFDGDGQSGMDAVSGDLFRRDGSISDSIRYDNYYGSILGNRPQVAADGLSMECPVIYANRESRFFQLEGRFTCTRSAPDAEEEAIDARLVLIERGGDRVYRIQVDPQRTVAFRKVELEVDLLKGTMDVGPADFKGIRRTIKAAMAEAGVQVVPGAGGERDLVEDGREAWRERDLHAFMDRHFSGFHPADLGWRIYMLIATRFRKATTTGVMFDQQGRHRQGVALFYKTRKERSREEDFERDYLRTAVHELGHAFNLLHSFDSRKRLGEGRRSNSFMNYPQNYITADGSRGEAHYWENFEFTFDNYEKFFMRHGHLEEVIMGGRPFGAGGHDEVEMGFEPGGRPGGLRLEIRPGPKGRDRIFDFGEPVYLEAILRNVGGLEVEVRDALHPAHGDTKYLIRKPNGSFSLYRPAFSRCDEDRRVVLDSHDPTRCPAIYEDILLAVDARDGFTFMEPGPYRVQATYESEGLTLYSNVLDLWVRYPDRDTETLIIPTFTTEVARYLRDWGSTDTVELSPLEKLFESPLGREHPLAAEYSRCRFLKDSEGYKVFHPERRLVTFRRPGPTVDVAKRALQAVGYSNRWHLSSSRMEHLPNLTLCHFAKTLSREIWEGFAGSFGKYIARFQEKLIDRLEANGAPVGAVEEMKRSFEANEPK